MLRKRLSPSLSAWRSSTRGRVRLSMSSSSIPGTPEAAVTWRSMDVSELLCPRLRLRRQETSNGRLGLARHRRSKRRMEAFIDGAFYVGHGAGRALGYGVGERL